MEEEENPLRQTDGRETGTRERVEGVKDWGLRGGGRPEKERGEGRGTG